MTLRIVSLLLIFLLVGSLVGWALSTGMSINYWFVVTSPATFLILFAIWYAFLGLGDARRRIRVSLGLVGLLILTAVVAACLLRYEGSTSGSSLPRLVWRWTDSGVEETTVRSRVGGSSIDPGLREEAGSVRTNFLGPGGDGMWKNVSFSLDWSTEDPVELWRRPIGAGWSSFAVDGGRAITQEQVEGSEKVTCLDLLTGEELWTQSDEGVTFLKAKEGRAGVLMGGEGPRGTPTIFGGRVFVLGSTGIAKCLSISSGDLLWQRNVITEFGGVIPKWGKSSSPLVLGEEELVLFTGSDEPGATVVACDLVSGETRWTYQGEGASYSTPRLLQIMGTPQVVCVNQNDVASLDPSTGEELWRFEWKGTNPKVGQPILIGENRILVSASYGVGSPLIEVQKDGESWTTERVWNSIRMKTKFSSVSVLGDLAFGLDEGRLAAISLEDGAKVWKREKFGFGQQLLVEDHLLIQTEPGDVVIGKVDEEQFTETGRIEALSSMTWNAPALAGRFLLVRNDREAVCYVLPRKSKKS